MIHTDIPIIKAYCRTPKNGKNGSGRKTALIVRIFCIYTDLHHNSDNNGYSQNIQHIVGSGEIVRTSPARPENDTEFISPEHIGCAMGNGGIPKVLQYARERAALLLFSAAP